MKYKCLADVPEKERSAAWDYISEFLEDDLFDMFYNRAVDEFHDKFVSEDLERPVGQEKDFQQVFDAEFEAYLDAAMNARFSGFSLRMIGKAVDDYFSDGTWGDVRVDESLTCEESGTLTNAAGMYILSKGPSAELQANAEKVDKAFLATVNQLVQQHVASDKKV